MDVGLLWQKIAAPDEFYVKTIGIGCTLERNGILNL
jgi:hypothetical protein